MQARLVVFLIGTLTGVALQAAEPAAATKPLPPPAGRQVDFVRDIQPIFADRCNHCHGEDEQQGQLRLDAKAIVLKGGVNGSLFIAGKSADSLLIQRVVGLGTEKRMPLEDDPLSDEEIGILRAWIDQGAKWPDGVGSKATEVKTHWAYVAPTSSPLPTVRHAAWPQSPIDSFILARLESMRIAPSPRSRPRAADPPRRSRSRRPAAERGRGRCVSGGPIARCLRAACRSLARFARVWRALGHALARRGPLCRQQRLSARRPPRRSGPIATV